MRLKKTFSRFAFIAQYYSKKLLFQIKRRAPLLKKLHLESFPAIHLKRMDWMDFILKFSSELLILILSLSVAGLNFIFFAGSGAKNYQDQSLAADFLQRHPGQNPKLYARNSSIITTVSGNGFVPQAEAEDFTGLGSQGLDSGQTPDDGSSIVMSDDDSLLAPSPDSIKSTLTNTIKKVYTTQAGDSLQSIAAANGVSVNSILWSNPLLTGASLKPGWSLIIPPEDGVVVTADSNTTLPDLAAEYSPDRYNPNKQIRDSSAAQLLDTIISYNGLDSAEDINAGDVIFIPGGVLAAPPAPPAPKAKPKSKNLGPDTSINDVTSIGDGYDGVNHLFPRGYCTYYVATQMKITFGGNAKSWLANAKASGYVTGQEPAARSAVVFAGYGYGRYGHVAYVQSVNGDGTITVSEMNYDHFNRVDTRTISVNSPGIRGYIYP
jgi:surface antigen